MFMPQCQLPGSAQDASDAGTASSGASSTAAGAPPALNVPRGNPLQDLFTPQPQYPTAQSQANPQPAAPTAGELNPLKGLFTPQPQYQTPQATRNPDGQPPDGEVNHFKGFFTPANQWATPQTVLNPDAVPRNLIPERQLLWGTDEEKAALIRQHNLNTFGTEQPPQAVPSRPGPGHAALEEQGKTTAPKGKAATTAQKEKITPGQKQKPTAANKQVAKSTASAPEQGKAAEAEGQPAAIAAPKTASSTPGAQPSRLREALSLIASAQYEKSVELLDHVLSDKHDDAQAHYLKAVALVKMHRYKDAAAEYKDVMRLAPSDKIGALAHDGLAKIGL